MALLTSRDLMSSEYELYGCCLHEDFPTEEFGVVAGVISYGKVHMDTTALKSNCLKAADSFACHYLSYAVSYWQEVHALQIA